MNKAAMSWGTISRGLIYMTSKEMGVQKKIFEDLMTDIFPKLDENYKLRNPRSSKIPKQKKH